MTMQQSFSSYVEGLRGKRVGLLGLGVSNAPLVTCFAKAGVSVVGRDRREEIEEAAHWRALGVELRLGEEYLCEMTEDIIFRSPGIRPDLKQLLDAEAAGTVLTSEMEVLFQVAPCPIIAVTGSDGKTTTTTLIAEMLQNEGHRVHLGGNIGTPLLTRVPEMAPTDFLVLELSSFQLMTMQHSPQVAVITNLSPNHLDIHLSMEEYTEAKCRIYRAQAPEDVLVLNADRSESAAFAQEAPGTLRFFSRLAAQEAGSFLREDGMLMLLRDGQAVEVCHERDILIPGVHNRENYLAAMAAVADFVSPAAMAQTARSFRGVEHRIELFCEKGGVKYYNDSIASSPTRTMAGLASFEEKLLLIAGGYDKKIPFDVMGALVCEKVKCLFLCGHTKEKIAKAVKEAPNYTAGAPEILYCDTLEDCVAAAMAQAKAGDTVLFSPACASFDAFPNFAARGRRFKELVQAAKG